MRERMAPSVWQCGHLEQDPLGVMVGARVAPGKCWALTMVNTESKDECFCYLPELWY